MSICPSLSPTLIAPLVYYHYYYYSNQVTAFKGRKIAIPKKKQGFNASYTLEGNTAVFPKTGSDIPDILSFVCVNDGEGGWKEGKEYPPRSRIFTGTGTFICVFTTLSVCL